MFLQINVVFIFCYHFRVPKSINKNDIFIPINMFFDKNDVILHAPFIFKTNIAYHKHDVNDKKHFFRIVTLFFVSLAYKRHPINMNIQY